MLRHEHASWPSTSRLERRWQQRESIALKYMMKSAGGDLQYAVTGQTKAIFCNWANKSYIFFNSTVVLTSGIQKKVNFFHYCLPAPQPLLHLSVSAFLSLPHSVSLSFFPVVTLTVNHYPPDIVTDNAELSAFDFGCLQGAHPKRR